MKMMNGLSPSVILILAVIWKSEERTKRLPLVELKLLKEKFLSDDFNFSKYKSPVLQYKQIQDFLFILYNSFYQFFIFKLSMSYLFLMVKIKCHHISLFQMIKFCLSTTASTLEPTCLTHAPHIEELFFFPSLIQSSQIGYLFFKQPNPRPKMYT